MTINIDEQIPKIRKMIDEIASDALEDFSTDLDAEIRQAIILTAQKMKRDLGRSFILPIAANELTVTGGSNGIGTVSLPDDFADLVELQMKGWTQPLTILMEPGSNEAKEQQHPWTRGNYNKPKAIMALDAAGENVIKYYTAAKTDGIYDHTLDHFEYLPVVDDDTTTLPITEGMYDVLLYQSAAVLMLSKNNTALAEQFASMGSTNDQADTAALTAQ